MSARQLLDQVQSLAKIDELEANPEAYAERVAAEAAVATELEQRDELLRRALGQIDAMIERVMRIRLDHVLASDASIAPPTRKVFATTIVGYVARIDLLETRARDVAARGGAADPDAVASSVGDAARAALALRDAVRAALLALIRSLAETSIPDADREARDRRLEEPLRRRWSAMRRELEAIAAQPDRISDPIATRLASWPDQVDESDVAEATFADMIELD